MGSRGLNTKKFQKLLVSYVKLVLGSAAQRNVSIYALCAQALRNDGFPCRPTKESVERYTEFMAGRVSNAARVVSFTPTSAKVKKPSFAATDDFLQTYEWRRLRMEALKMHGARCQCCGATPADGVRMHVDHIKPRRLFPQLALTLSNLQVLCEACNHGKGNWDMTDWRASSAVVELTEEQREHMLHI